MQTCKSKVNLINHRKPTILIEVVGKRKKEEIQNFLCKKGDMLNIVSKSNYEWKEGIFYILTNAKNDTLFLDSTEVALVDTVEEKDNFSIDDF